MMEDDSNCNVVRALRNFDATDDDELSLRKDDILQVARKVDKFWYYGCCNGQWGKFPTGHVYPMDLPSDFEEDGTFRQLFAATNKFSAQEPGDLPFNRGELIVGIKAIDDNWWEGSCRGTKGIFPLSHVWQLDSSKIISSIKNVASHSGRESLPGNNLETIPISSTMINVQTSPEPEPFYGNTSSSPPIRPAEPLYSNVENAAASSDSGASSSTLPLLVQAQYNFIGELPSDLPFKKGDIIRIIRQVDSNWMEGELDGHLGIFPSNYVKPLKGIPSRTNEEGASFPPGTLGQVLFDFAPQQEGDLQLIKNETVTLLRKIGLDWYEAQSPSGKIGICPASFVRVIESDRSLDYENLGASPQIIKSSCEDLPPSYEDVIFQTSFSKEGINTFNQDKNLTSEKLEIKKGQLKKLEQYQKKLREELEMDPAPQVVEEINKQIATYQDQVDGLKNEIRFLADDLARQMFGPKTTSPSSNVQIRPHSHEITPQSEYSNTGRHSRPVSEGSEFSQGTFPNLGPSGTSSTFISSASPSSLDDMDQQERRRMKHEEQRQCVMTELLQTEKDYIKDMKVCRDVLRNAKSRGEAAGVNISALLGNLDEVIEVADRLYRRMNKGITSGSSSTQIGQCFLEMADDIKQAYGHFCRNHDEVTSLLEKYSSEPRAQALLSEILQSIQAETNCFNLGSILIKPVQRLLKYPLLLGQLKEATPSNHPDYTGIDQAIATMTNLAHDINNFKLRQELLDKYRNVSQQSFSEKISKLNLHSVLKKSARLSMKLSSTLGLTQLSQDEPFERCVEDFHNLEKTLKAFYRDVELLTGHMEDLYKSCLSLSEDVASFYRETKSSHIAVADKFRALHHNVLSQFWAEFKSSVEGNVTGLLSRLLKAFTTPKFLIEKCYDKKLDHAAASWKLEKNKDVTRKALLSEEEANARRDYEALHDQLMAELPTLTEQGNAVLADCLGAFLLARRSLLGKMAALTLDLLQPFVRSDCSTWSKDQQEVVDQLSRLSIVPANLFPKVAPQNVLKQSEASRTYLKMHYSKDQLYIAKGPFQPSHMTGRPEVSLQPGDLVGVKHGNPGEALWMVDNGTTCGFVPSSYLVPLNATPPTKRNSFLGLRRTSSPSPTAATPPPPPYQSQKSPVPAQTSPSTAQSTSLITLSPPSPSPSLTRSEPSIQPLPALSTPFYDEVARFDPLYQNEPEKSQSPYQNVTSEDVSDHRYEEIPETPPASPTVPDSFEYYYAKYPFSVVGPGQLSLFEGQVVGVLRKSDFNGNAEWWQVQNRYGQIGFVPEAYLRPYTQPH